MTPSQSGAGHIGGGPLPPGPPLPPVHVHSHSPRGQNIILKHTANSLAGRLLQRLALMLKLLQLGKEIIKSAMSFADPTRSPANELLEQGGTISVRNQAYSTGAAPERPLAECLMMRPRGSQVAWRGVASRADEGEEQRYQEGTQVARSANGPANGCAGDVTPPLGLAASGRMYPAAVPEPCLPERAAPSGAVGVERRGAVSVKACGPPRPPRPHQAPIRHPYHSAAEQAALS